MSAERVLWPVVAVVLAAWGVVDAVVVGWSSPVAVSVPVALLAGLPVVGLAHRPRLVATAVTSVLVVHALVWSQPEAPPETLVLLVVAFGLGAYGPVSYPLWLVLGAGVAVLDLRDLDDPGLGGLLFLVGSWVSALAVGAAVSRHRHAEHEDRLVAASTRAAGPEVAAAALAAERERIARDLHDVVTGSVERMVEQAAVAREVALVEPSAAEAALRRVEEVGQQALTDLRRMLGLIRGGSDLAGPQPGVAAVPSLVEQAGATLTVEGDLAGVPAGPSVAAYRILQEALADPGSGPCSVSLRRVAGRLVLELVTAGPIAGQERGPVVDGMRRRAELYGGHVDVAADRAGRRVRVTLPL